MGGKGQLFKKFYFITSWRFKSVLSQSHGLFTRHWSVQYSSQVKPKVWDRIKIGSKSRISVKRFGDKWIKPKLNQIPDSPSADLSKSKSKLNNNQLPNDELEFWGIVFASFFTLALQNKISQTLSLVFSVGRSELTQIQTQPHDYEVSPSYLHKYC